MRTAILPTDPLIKVLRAACHRDPLVAGWLDDMLATENCASSLQRGDLGSKAVRGGFKKRRAAGPSRIIKNVESKI
jgi:hypothetical protein